jgi:hypothetical protein
MGPDMVPVLLGKQLLGCVATALKDKDSYLHASAKRCLVSGYNMYGGNARKWVHV